MNRRLIALAAAFCAALVAVLVPGLVVGSPEHARQPTRTQPQPERPLTATTFLRQTIRMLAANEYAAAWRRLDPEQQELIPRDSYVRCESASPVPGRLAHIDALLVQRERVVVPGSLVPAQPSVAVTFRLAFAPFGSHAPVVVRVRAHAIRRGDGRWSWMLPAKRVALHRSGRCGLPPAVVGPAL